VKNGGMWGLHLAHSQPINKVIMRHTEKYLLVKLIITDHKDNYLSS